jgi:hypothetical protein
MTEPTDNTKHFKPIDITQNSKPTDELKQRVFRGDGVELDPKTMKPLKSDPTPTDIDPEIRSLVNDNFEKLLWKNPDQIDDILMNLIMAIAGYEVDDLSKDDKEELASAIADIKALITTTVKNACLEEISQAIKHGDTVNAPMTGFRNYLELRQNTLARELQELIK